MTIAIYSGEIPSTTFIERLINGFARVGHNVQLFGIKRRSVKYSNGVEVFGYKDNQLNKGLHLLRYSLLLWLFRKKDKVQLDIILKKNNKYNLNTRLKSYPVLWHRPDIFHLQWAKGINDWMWVREFGMKLVVSLRGAHINYSPIADSHLVEIYEQNFPKVDAFHAVSKAIGIEAQKYGAHPSKIKVVYSGLDISMKVIPDFDNQKSNFKILSVGRSHWIKGYRYALDACKILKDSDFSFNYIIVGGTGDTELLYQIYDLGLEDHVELLDNTPFEIVKDYLKNADVLLIPSLKEGIPNVALEAMLFGTMVISTDCGGIDEVIESGQNGFLIPVRNPNSLAKMLIEIQSIPERQSLEIREQAQKTILKQHNENTMISQMLDLYKSCLL